MQVITGHKHWMNVLKIIEFVDRILVDTLYNGIAWATKMSVTHILLKLKILNGQKHCFMP